ncbi:LacI family DNA-binding transcriptional regulator [Lutibacter sp. B1]|uniref:LacI family DNA-binding transcriptional regulator n=1 Tax=Lutibacter sp. B1 TaxID=2725996 RepID=UPI0014574FBF|nr:LacI family DNA-binding transcriptional regulator [Lutibacter sp. B1]NLP56856.1 LacI family transcriptional regulator [Lutibacter sp. B1]
MNKKVTIYDIAKKLDITAATVSRALNNSPRISAKTRELVMNTAIEMNYKQNKLALALKSGKSKTIGVIVPHVNRSFFSYVIRGIEEELYPHDYQVIICQTYNEAEREIKNINALINAQVDGILMSISNISNEKDHIIYKIPEKNIPLIFFDKKINIKGTSYVTINDFKGGYMATEHLIKEGCTKIAHLYGDLSYEIYKDRFEGYKRALFDYGIDFNEKYVIQTISSTESGQNAVEELLKLETLPDAIFSSSDFVALGAIQKLKSKGFKIPEDVCVVGFSNEPFTKFMELSITSVDQFPLEMGKMAAQVFLEQIDNGEIKKDKKVIFTPKLHIRKSSSKTNKI